jgi:hypothetical protein
MNETLAFHLISVRNFLLEKRHVCRLRSSPRRLFNQRKVHNLLNRSPVMTVALRAPQMMQALSTCFWGFLFTKIIHTYFFP